MKSKWAEQRKSTHQAFAVPSALILPGGRLSPDNSFVGRCSQVKSSSSILRMQADSPNEPDVIIIGSGFGGLSAAAALTAYGMKPLVLESHTAAGGVAHGFTHRNSKGLFKFDTGPSFFCSLVGRDSLNPLKHALDAVEESVQVATYNCFAIDDVRLGSILMYDDASATIESLRALAGPVAASQMSAFYEAVRRIHAAMDVPAIALRGDWRLAPVLVQRWAPSLLSLLPHVGVVSEPILTVMKSAGVTHPFVRRVLDIEAFLLSGLKTDATITAEIAFMIGEREKRGSMQYPRGGASAIVDALVRGICKKGGEVRLRSHVDEILVRNGAVEGVRLKSGERIYAQHVFSNASIWDTIHNLLPEESLPAAYRKKALETPMVESFMHAHIAIPSRGLESLVGHHAVVLDSTEDIAKPGNTVMVSIPTIWSPELAPEGWHIIHTYTLEPYDNWPAIRKNRKVYEDVKKQTAQPLFSALRHIIPDLDERLNSEGSIVKLGSPLTHARFSRRYRGTYGAAIPAGKAEFEWPNDIPIRNLKRCGDSTFPGIGVPSSAAAGIIAANELVGVREHKKLIDKLFPITR